MAARERVYDQNGQFDATRQKGRSRHHNELLLFDADSKDVLSFHIGGVLWTDVVDVAEHSDSWKHTSAPMRRGSY